MLGEVTQEELIGICVAIQEKYWMENGASQISRSDPWIQQDGKMFQRMDEAGSSLIYNHRKSVAFQSVELLISAVRVVLNRQALMKSHGLS